MKTFTHDQPGTPATDWAAHPRATGLASLEGDLQVAHRVVVLAAHPDDESLGAGGLLARASAGGLDVVVVVATDGEASHPASMTHSAGRLAELRRAEEEAAVGQLGADIQLITLGLPDGGLQNHQHTLTATLVELVRDGRGTLLVAPWRRDGHPDHEAAGRAAAAAAVRTSSTLREYPIWWWHWATPDETPWAELRELRLMGPERRAKVRAQAAHVTQVTPLSDRPGDEVLLGADFLTHFEGDRELYVATPDVLPTPMGRDA